MRSKLAFFFLLGGAFPAFGLVLVRAVTPKNEALVLVTSDATNLVNVDDSVCLFESGKPIACGTVVKKLKSGDAIRLSWSKRKLASGDNLGIAKQRRVPASLPGAISYGGTSTTSAAAGKETGYKKFISVGAMGGTEFIAPGLHAQFRVSNRLRMGLLGSYSANSDAFSKVSLIGMFATIQFLPFLKVPSVSLQAMAGGYLLSSTVDTVAESAQLLSFSTVLEWRQFLGGGLFLAAAGGFNYTSKPQLQLADVNIAGFKPLVLIQLGFAW